MQEQAFAIFLKMLVFENPPNINANAASVLHTFLNIYFYLLFILYFHFTIYHQIDLSQRVERFFFSIFWKYIHFLNKICALQVYVSKPKEIYITNQQIWPFKIKIILSQFIKIKDAIFRHWSESMLFMGVFFYFVRGPP